MDGDTLVGYAGRRGGNLFGSTGVEGRCCRRVWRVGSEGIVPRMSDTAKKAAPAPKAKAPKEGEEDRVPGEGYPPGEYPADNTFGYGANAPAP